MRISASEAFVETLVAHGVTDVFGIVGSAYMDALDLFPAAGIRFVSVAHEQNAAHMADGYSRVSGRHGVCIAQNGPGITNFVTAIAAAFWAHSPVVAITPETGSLGVGLGGFQETDQLRLGVAAAAGLQLLFFQAGDAGREPGVDVFFGQEPFRESVRTFHVLNYLVYGFGKL